MRIIFSWFEQRVSCASLDMTETTDSGESDALRLDPSGMMRAAAVHLANHGLPNGRYAVPTAVTTISDDEHVVWQFGVPVLAQDQNGDQQ